MIWNFQKFECDFWKIKERNFCYIRWRVTALEILCISICWRITQFQFINFMKNWFEPIKICSFLFWHQTFSVLRPVPLILFAHSVYYTIFFKNIFSNWTPKSLIGLPKVDWTPKLQYNNITEFRQGMQSNVRRNCWVQEFSKNKQAHNM